MTRKTLYVVFSVYFILVIGFISFPVSIKLINKVDPFLLGIPLLQFMIILTTVLMGIGFLVWFMLEEKIETQIAKENGVNING